MGQLLSSLQSAAGAVQQGVSAVNPAAPKGPTAPAPVTPTDYSAAPMPPGLNPDAPQIEVPVAPAPGAPELSVFQQDTPQDPLASIYDPSLGGVEDPSGVMGVNPLAQQDNPYGLDIDNAPEDFAGKEEDPIDITGDRFKPKKLNILEQVADFFLRGRLGATVRDQNMRAAMEGIQTDPEAAIRRVNTFDGRAAYEMYKNLQDDKRADAAQESLAGSRWDRALTPLRATVGTILEMPEEKRAEAWKIMAPRLKAARDTKGIPAELFDVSEEYDDLSVRSLYVGGIAPPKQEALKDADARIAQGDRRIDVSERQGDERIGIAQQNANTSAGRAAVAERQGDARIAQGDQRIALTRDERYRAQEKRHRERIAVLKGLPKNPSLGTTVVGKTNKDIGLRYLKGGNGKQGWFKVKKVNGTWQAVEPL